MKDIDEIEEDFVCDDNYFYYAIFKNVCLNNTTINRNYNLTKYIKMIYGYIRIIAKSLHKNCSFSETEQCLCN